MNVVLSWSTVLIYGSGHAFIVIAVLGAAAITSRSEFKDIFPIPGAALTITTTGLNTVLIAGRLA